jgi:hypothetical protein
MKTETQLDDRDQAILDARVKEWNQIRKPRVGDFIKMLDGTVRRFTHDWDDGLQTTMGTAPCNGDQSFYFGGSFVSFSGSLDSTIPNECIKPRHEMRDGPFWFFHHDMAMAHNGVGFTVPCRIYEQTHEEVAQ